jgi:hypothetical protein
VQLEHLREYPVKPATGARWCLTHAGITGSVADRRNRAGDDRPNQHADLFVDVAAGDEIMDVSAVEQRNRQAIDGQLAYMEFLATLLHDEVARREQK